MGSSGQGFIFTDIGAWRPQARKWYCSVTFVETMTRSACGHRSCSSASLSWAVLGGRRTRFRSPDSGQVPNSESWSGTLAGIPFGEQELPGNCHAIDLQNRHARWAVPQAQPIA